MPEFLSNVDMEWLPEVQRAPYLCRDGAFYTCKAVSLFLEAKLVLRGRLVYGVLKKGNVLFLWKIFWMLCSVAILRAWNELGGEEDMEGIRSQD